MAGFDFCYGFAESLQVPLAVEGVCLNLEGDALSSDDCLDKHVDGDRHVQACIVAEFLEVLLVIVVNSDAKGCLCHRYHSFYTLYS